MPMYVPITDRVSDLVEFQARMITDDNMADILSLCGADALPTGWYIFETPHGWMIESPKSFEFRFKEVN